MQKDFHFFAVAVLARSAGFSAEDSVTIAYASQYVDDSTESKPIQVGNSFFDPARTAHFGIFSFDWNIQKLIFIPFHFLPASRDFFAQGSYITEKNSELAGYLLQQAIEDDSDIRLHRIGLALHTFADTWAHRGFSGRHNEENSVSSIKIRKRDRFRSALLKNIYLNLLPEIGHSEAKYCPDIPYLHWRCKINRTSYESDNADIFLEAAEEIYRRLSQSKNMTPVKSWEELEKDFTALFTFNKNLKKRCNNWQKRYGPMFPEGYYQYDRFIWRKKALNVTRDKDVDWDKFSRSKMAKLKYPESSCFPGSDWIKFHKAARLQRALVVRNIRE